MFTFFHGNISFFCNIKSTPRGAFGSFLLVNCRFIWQNGMDNKRGLTCRGVFNQYSRKGGEAMKLSLSEALQGAVALILLMGLFVQIVNLAK